MRTVYGLFCSSRGKLWKLEFSRPFVLNKIQACNICCWYKSSNLSRYLWAQLASQLSCLCQNLPGKMGQQSAICWNSFGLFRDYGLNYNFLGIIFFMFFKIESWNFQHLFEISISWTLVKFQLIQTNIQTTFFYGEKKLFEWAEILWGFTKF